MRIAVTGGTGIVGGFIVDHLLAAGHEVRLMVRPGGRAAEHDVPTAAIRLDPDSDFRPLLDGCDALVHAAFQHQPGRYRHGEGDDLPGFLRANVSGSLALLVQARQAGIGRTVILSSRAVYGRQPPGAMLREDMPVCPDTHYGAAKAALEAFVSSFALQDGWPACALRPTGVYGLLAPVQRSKWYELVVDILAGRPVPATGGTEVHGADVAAAVACLLDAAETDVAGRMFNCSDLYVSTRNIAEIVRARTGHEVGLPAPPADRAACNVMDCARLTHLGMVFAGKEALEQTIEAMVAHHGHSGSRTP